MAEPIFSKRIIFENEHVESLCIRWKRDGDFRTMHEIGRQLANLIDSIIRGSNFVQSTSFHDLRNSLFTQMPKWLEKWVPGEGKFYTYVTRCIQNGCLGYLGKENVYKGRFVSTDAPFESLNPEASSYSQRFDEFEDSKIAEEVAKIPTRWHEPEIREVCRVFIKAILRNRASPRRKILIETVTTAYPVEQDEAKFLLDWCSASVRMIYLERYSHPLTEMDILMSSEKFGYMPDLISSLGFKTTKKLLTIFAGCTVKFPSPGTITKVSRAVSELNKGGGGMATESAYKILKPSLINIASGIFEEKALQEA